MGVQPNLIVHLGILWGHLLFGGFFGRRLGGRFLSDRIFRGNFLCGICGNFRGTSLSGQRLAAACGKDSKKKQDKDNEKAETFGSVHGDLLCGSE
jgi:hypothetical protein